MWPFSKKTYDKSPLQIIEEELKRLHDVQKHSVLTYDAEKQISKLNDALIQMAKVEIAEGVSRRLKAVEDAVADLYLTGRSNDKPGTG